MEPAIRIEHISKQFKKGTSGAPYLALRDALTQILKKKNNITRPTPFWALQDINLTIGQGERVGIIGRNGAGKSTLLKIISRITPPTEGRIVLEGRVASLLEVGTGFHPELTGRENIYLNGSILGMRKAEITQRLDEIIAFSGVENFIDTPLKHYSSGMQLRLAFSVAAHLEPEILLIDEVLAVGDIEFQKKCLGKMEEVSKTSGRTIVFVSHNLSQLQRICNRAVLLDHGRIVADGKTAAVIDEYQRMVFKNNAPVWEDRQSSSDFVISGVCMRDRLGRQSDVVDAGQETFIELRVRAARPVTNSLIAIRFTNEQNVPVYTTTNGDEALTFPIIGEGETVYQVPVPFSLFVPGFYQITIAWIIPNYEVLYQVKDDIRILVENDSYPGNILLDGRKETFTRTIKWQTTKEHA